MTRKRILGKKRGRRRFNKVSQKKEYGGKRRKMEFLKVSSKKKGEKKG